MNFVKRAFPIIALMLLLTMLLSPIIRAESRTSAQEAFLTYKCEYEAATNTARINAVLTDTSGLPMPRDRYNLTITTAATVRVVPPQRISISMLPRRAPLRLVIVMDTTDTMPLKDLVTAISTRLVPRMDVSDQVAFLRVDSSIAPLTPFYIDKNRLINENMLDLQPGFGDNRVYDGILAAVEQLGTTDGMRQAVLVLTDSAPRKPDEQATAAEIGTRARNARVQIYPIGIFLYDDPNAADLISMAQASQGFAWIYDEDNATNASTGVAVGERLEDLIDTLNSEIQIAIDMRGQIPDTSGLVLFDIALDLQNGLKLTDQIGCPVTVTTHDIAFAAGTPATQTTSQPVDITVQVESDFSAEETSIVFRVNDEPVQNSDNPTYTFNSPTFAPGTYRITAQLRDRSDNILATTAQAITITTQPAIDLRVISGSLADLNQPLVLEVDTASTVPLPDVRFNINKVREPVLVYPLGGGVAPFQSGRAILTVPDMKGEVERLFPGIQTGEVLEIVATVPSNAPGGGVLAISKPLTFTYSASGTVLPVSTAIAVQLSGGTPVPDSAATTTGTNTAASGAATILGVAIPVFLTQTDPVLLWSVILSLILLIINLLMFFQVGRQRIRRMINNPDGSDMSQRLMALTVRRDSIKQTLPLTKRTVTLGRGNLNDVNLGDSTAISREHGVVMWRKGKWFYSNRKPRLKCRIDGKRYSGYILIELEPVTEIQIGDARVFFHSSTQQDVSEFSKTTL